MVDKNLQQELNTLVIAILNTIELIYEKHRFFIKSITYFFLICLAYRLGKASAADPIETDIDHFREVIKKRERYTIYLPKKIQLLTKITKFIGYFLILMLIILGLTYYLDPVMISDYHLKLSGIALALVFVIILIIWSYKSLLSFWVFKGGYNDTTVQVKATNILTLLGKRAELLLKGTLCFEKISKLSNTGVGCQKIKCQQQRIVLKEKIQIIAKMVQNVLKFQWCSVCKRRQYFDEFLPFRQEQYVCSQDIAVEQEVQIRNNYLIEQIERMVNWVKQINPCNCSVRYWTQSMAEVQQYKNKDRILSQKLIAIQKESPQPRSMQAMTK